MVYATTKDAKEAQASKDEDAAHTYVRVYQIGRNQRHYVNGVPADSNVRLVDRLSARVFEILRTDNKIEVEIYNSSGMGEYTWNIYGRKDSSYAMVEVYNAIEHVLVWIRIRDTDDIVTTACRTLHNAALAGHLPGQAIVLLMDPERCALVVQAIEGIVK